MKKIDRPVRSDNQKEKFSTGEEMAMGSESDSARQQKLADEILESQKTRSDLLRWKLVICAILGSAGFGLTGSGSLHIGLLALLPLACVYIDLLCTNLNLRIILIGGFFTSKEDPYESFVGPRRVVFCLEDWALYGSTYVLSGLLFLLAMVHLGLAVFQTGSTGLRCLECGSIFVSSAITMILTRWTQQAYKLLMDLTPLDKSIDAEAYFIGQLSEKNLRFKWFLTIAKRFVRGVAGADRS